MGTVAKKAIMQALVEGVLTELMVKTHSDNVYIDETTTLSSKLAEIVTAINLRAKSEDVTSEIQTAIDNLIGGAPETYDTLVEISTYITEHQEVVDTLNAAIGNKADKSTVEAIQSTITSLGTLAQKSSVSESDLDSALLEKINNASSGNHSHSNKTVLDGITSEMVTEWNSKGTVFVASSSPSELAAGDLFIQIVE